MRIIEAGIGAGSVTLYDLEPTAARLCEDVAHGLARTPKRLPSKYFYDERGAELFERITRLEEYYPTRTEISILRAHAAAMARRIGPHVRLVEFGSGSGEKTWLLLKQLQAPAAYVPVDISRTQLIEFALAVSDAFPSLRVMPVCADYTARLELPPAEEEPARTVAFFPGSTLGNFETEDADAFLRRVRRLVGPRGGLLLGLDLIKDPAILERAYNDAEGVTARFNLNLLKRINRECGTDFDLGAFRHRAFYDERESRVEMQLISERSQAVRAASSEAPSALHTIRFDAGEPLTTEYSYKFDLERFAGIAGRAGWRVSATWTDPAHLFAVLLLE